MFRNYSTQQWVNLGAFILASLGMGSWWQSLYTPEHAAMVSGGLLWITSIANFLMTGKPATP